MKPEHGLERHHTETAVGHGRINLLIKSLKMEGLRIHPKIRTKYYLKINTQSLTINALGILQGDYLSQLDKSRFNKRLSNNTSS